MIQQTIDLHINSSQDLRTLCIPVIPEVNEPPLTRWLPGRSKWLLPMGFWLLIGFFYLAAFFPQHQPFEAAAFIFLGLSAFAGLLEATSVPAAVPVLSFNDVVHVTLGAVAVQLAIRTAGITAVQAAAFVGVLAWLSERLKLLSQRVRSASLYCGAFAGMTSSHVLPGLGWLTLAGILAGILYSLAKHFWVGIGGKLGTMAFAGTAITVALARFSGLNHQNRAAASVDPVLQLAIVGVTAVSVSLTYWLSKHRKFGAVFWLGSAVCSAGVRRKSAQPVIAIEDDSANSAWHDVVWRQFCGHDLGGAPGWAALDAAFERFDLRLPVGGLRSSTVRFRRRSRNDRFGVSPRSIWNRPVIGR